MHKKMEDADFVVLEFGQVLHDMIGDKIGTARLGW